MNTRKIFIVDDDELLGVMLSDFLTERNLGNVSLFQTGESCVEQMNAVQPDVVVLDYHLNSKFASAKNGMEILDTIHQKYQDVYVIMLSSQTSYGVASRTIANGALHYVIKGSDSFQEVADIIEGL